MKIRTIPVELDVASPKGRLASGIFPEVVWPGRSEDDSVCSGIVGRRDTEATFVVCIHAGASEWVKPSRRKANRDFGDLHLGDEVAPRGTDQLSPGTRVSAKRSRLIRKVHRNEFPTRN